MASNRYRVKVTNAAGTEGIEGIALNAPDEATAKTVYAALGGTTVAALEEAGLTEWTVEQVTE